MPRVVVMPPRQGQGLGKKEGVSPERREGEQGHRTRKQPTGWACQVVYHRWERSLNLIIGAVGISSEEEKTMAIFGFQKVLPGNDMERRAWE